MRAAISLLVLLLSMCGVQTESQGTGAAVAAAAAEVSTQLDVSTELRELRDMVVDLRATLRHTQDADKVLEADNIAMKQRLAVSESKVEVLEADNEAVKQRLATSESKVEALERALRDTKAEMRAEVDNLKTENATPEAELTAVKTSLAATKTDVENLEKEIRASAAAPKVAFSASLASGFTAARDGAHLVFSRVITNVGEAYSSTTGFFTAPVKGVYYFRFTLLDFLIAQDMRVQMRRNVELVMQLHEYDTDGHSTYLSSGLALQLEKGDDVWMDIPRGHRLFNDLNNHSTFSGFLLFPL